MPLKSLTAKRKNNLGLSHVTHTFLTFPVRGRSSRPIREELVSGKTISINRCARSDNSEIIYIMSSISVFTTKSFNFIQNGVFNGLLSVLSCISVGIIE